MSIYKKKKKTILIAQLSGEVILLKKILAPLAGEVSIYEYRVKVHCKGGDYLYIKNITSADYKACEYL